MKHEYIVVGGSAGSFQTIVGLVNALPKDYKASIILCLHRLKHVRAGFVEALAIKTKLPIIEPEDQMPIKPGCIYLAPANYHLLINSGSLFALSAMKAVNHSRPSIDLLFRSASYYLGPKALGVLLSGANKDGAEGLYLMHKASCKTVIQKPDDAQVSAMPLAALSIFAPDMQLTQGQIIDLIAIDNMRTS